MRLQGTMAPQQPQSTQTVKAFTAEETRVISERVQRAMYERRMKQKHIEEKTGIDQTLLSNIFHGRRRFQRYQVESIAAALEISVAELLDGIDGAVYETASPKVPSKSPPKPPAVRKRTKGLQDFLDEYAHEIDPADLEALERTESIAPDDGHVPTAADYRDVWAARRALRLCRKDPSLRFPDVLAGILRSLDSRGEPGAGPRRKGGSRT